MYVYPGGVLTSATPITARTILGSCVAVCIWDPVLEVGGMNHFVLPLRLGTADVRAPITRFANEAIVELLRQVKALGADEGRLKAKVFGGMCASGEFRNTPFDLGARNVEIAHEAMAAAKIAIVSEDVGGTRGRSLRFFTGDGSAWIKHL